MYYKLVLTIISVTAFVTALELSKKWRSRKVVYLCALVIYLTAVFYVVALKGARIGMGGVSIKFPLPFYKAFTSHYYGLVANRSVLNILLFVPFGYLLPQGGSEFRRKWKMNLWKTMIAGFGFSFLIESFQYIFRVGVFELDDLVKNTMGAMVGWMIWRLLNRNKGRQI